MLQIKGLHLKFGQNQVLQDLSVDLEDNAVHGIVGMNGSGKTSLLRAIQGSVHFQQGVIQFSGDKVSRKKVGLLETQNFFYPRITGKEYLELFLMNNPDYDLDGWNQLFNLPLSHLIESYSTGMKKKLAFMGLLSLNRPILILDEPFNGLDLETSETLKRIIPRLKQAGRVVLITSHIKDSLVRICDKIHHLKEGIIKNTYTASAFDALDTLLEQRQIDQIDKLMNDFNK